IIADQNESAYFSRYLHDSSMLVVGSPQSLAPANAQLSISFALNKFGDKSNKSSQVESRIE
ncbi:hypothetical protein, partial [Vibrio campbellii]|uniref:hypothetical protein n=1 Tax=Vibrio campbellii TaxID=680 RepID=UPI001BDA3A5E